METNLSADDKLGIRGKTTENETLDPEQIRRREYMKRRVDDFISSRVCCINNEEERYRWHRREITREEFYKMIRLAALNKMRKRGTYEDFIFDDNNKTVVDNLFYYLTGDDEKCQWNIDKGIFFYGKIGCGKTLLMSAFLDVVYGMCGIVTDIIHAKQIYDIINKNGIERLANCVLFIDELGRESLEINEFGNKIRPIQDLIAVRYESGARTFCTSNFSIAALEGKNENGVQKGYGKYVRTRMEEMMNIVEMPGDNRRPKYTTNG